jgi:peroxiredoxin
MPKHQTVDGSQVCQPPLLKQANDLAAAAFRNAIVTDLRPTLLVFFGSSIVPRCPSIPFRSLSMKRLLSLFAVVALAIAAPVFAADPGEKAPDFKGLKGVDGKDLSLSDLKDAKAVVVCFTCNICPVSVAYEDRFVEFTKKYKDKGVAFVAINCNTKTEDLAAMKTRAEDKGFNFPYVFDESGKTATEYGAKVTPHIYVLDGKRTIQYVGSFDDKQKEPSKHYVADAVDAVLAGKTVETASTKAFGCGIQNKK